MIKSEAISQLMHYQNAISETIARGNALVEQGPGQAIELGKLRWEQFRVLRGYQLFKHGEIFDPAIRCGNLADVALAVGMKARCTTAGNQVVAYLMRWGGRDIAGCWDEFVADRCAFNASLRAHMAIERRDIASALETVTDTRRRA